MARCSARSVIGAAILASAAVSATGAAAAGPCGGFLAVDEPTTLQKAARACNVSYASLREANPGVNPNNVRPGQHLSVPVSLRHAAVGYSALPAASSAKPKLAAFTRPLGFREETDQRVRLLAANFSPDAPSWLDDGNNSGHYTSSAPLSFQKASALRIEIAGSTVETDADGIPLARFTNNPKVTSGYRLPDYNSIGVRPSEAAIHNADTVSLTGTLLSEQGNCFALRTDGGKVWRLSADSNFAQDAYQILGKTITVWGAKDDASSCGKGTTLRVSEAVYAEPWTDGE